MGELWTLADDAGRDLVPWVVRTNAAVMVLLIGVAGADLLLRRRVSASWRIALYVLVVLRVALPFAWPGPFASSGFARAALPAEWSEVTYAVADESRVEQADAGVTATGTQSNGRDWGRLVVLAWAGVSSGLAAQWMFAIAGLRREIAARGVLIASERGVRVVEHPSLGPLVAGVLRPVVVLPRGLAASVGAERASWVLRHEMNHVERLDPLAAFALRAVCVMCWPVVPLWLAAARVRSLMEQACDERTVINGDRAAYAEALLAVASRSGKLRPAAGLAFGVGVRSRIAALSAGRRWPAFVQGLAVGCAALGLAACAGEGSRAGEGEVRAAETANQPAPITIETKVLGGVPAGAGIDVSTGAAWTVILSADQAARVVALADANPETATMSSPTIVVLEDQPARIMVGAQTENGEMTEGIELLVKAHRRGGATELNLRYRERGGGKAEFDSRSLNMVPDDGVLVCRLTDSAGARSRMLVVRTSVKSAEPAAAVQTAEGASFLTMVNIMTARGYLFPDAEPLASAGGSSSRKLLVRKDASGTLLIGPDDPASRERVKGAWAVVASDGAVLRMMETLRDHAGASVLAVPAIITRTGERGQVSMTDQDKAHAQVGRDLAVMCDAAEGGVTMTFEGRGATRVRADGLSLPAGDSLLIFVGQDTGPHEVYAVRPSRLAGGSGQVYQTSGPLEQPPR
ncbi:MAG: M56 family metallopeptidase [Phycisphaerales bacterium]